MKSDKITKLIKIANKIKCKVSDLLIEQMKGLEKKGQHIIDVDKNDQSFSINYLKKHVFSKLKKGDIEINVSDLSKGRFQIAVPNIKSNKLRHLYVLPEIRELVLKSLNKKEIKYLEILSLVSRRMQEQRNLDLSSQFSFSGVSANQHVQKIAEIDDQLESIDILGT